MSRALVVFLDGVGVGPADPVVNPFSAVPPPAISALLAAGRATLAPLDATLDTPGLPQSGTGQYSLFTGDNGARRFGRHHGPWVPTALRDPLRTDNLLTRARHAGRRVAFANAYPEELVLTAERSGAFTPVGPLRSGLPLVAYGAGVLTRHLAALQAGEALSSDITHDRWRAQGVDVPPITARAAGANLARIVHRQDLTLFAHYATDAAGHAQRLDAAVEALALVDEFLDGLLSDLDGDVSLFIVSDHGNLEDVSAGHTRNPAFGLVAGPAHETWAGRLTAITDVPAVVLSALGSADQPPDRSQTI